MHHLANRHERIFKFISGYIATNHEAPTIKEIGEEFNLRSSSSVHQILVTLESDGKIKRIPNISRGIRLIETPINAS